MMRETPDTEGMVKIWIGHWDQQFIFYSDTLGYRNITKEWTTNSEPEWFRRLWALALIQGVHGESDSYIRPSDCQFAVMHVPPELIGA